MVQMKGTKKNLTKLIKIFLYIPHGSDEREKCRILILSTTELYIPHGSDERRKDK